VDAPLDPEFRINSDGKRPEGLIRKVEEEKKRRKKKTKKKKFYQCCR
jgi:hypothetical protein